MWLVKLGGSLMSSNEIHDVLGVLSKSGKGKVLLIPGGGIFADQIRELQQDKGFDDQSAHHMALLAMEQFAFYCRSLLPELELVNELVNARVCLKENKLACFLPSQYLSNMEGIPENWAFTSDSISALLAAEFNAEGLILLKSCQQVIDGCSLEELAESGLVDPLFPGYGGKLNCPIHCLAAKDDRSLSTILISS